MIDAETANSITLKRAENQTDTVLRAGVQRFGIGLAQLAQGGRAVGGQRVAAAVVEFERLPLRRVDAHRQRADAALQSRVDGVIARGRGEPVDVEGVVHVHRPLRAWIDLAGRTGWRSAS